MLRIFGLLYYLIQKNRHLKMIISEIELEKVSQYIKIQNSDTHLCLI